MEGLAQLNKTIELIINRLNPSLEIEGLLLTMYDTRNNICKTVASEVKEFFKDKVLKTLIPKNVKLAESPSFGKCIFDYEFNFPSCFILGNEVNGISEDLLNCVSDHIEISMKGIKQSFNVSVAAGIVCSEMTRQNLLLS